MTPKREDEHQHKAMITTIFLLVTMAWYLICRWNARYLSILIAVAIVKDAADNTTASTSNASERAIGPSSFSTRKMIEQATIKGWVSMPTRKSVSARPNSKVFEGEWRAGVRQTAISMTPFPNVAGNEQMALRMQLIRLEVRTAERSSSNILELKWRVDIWLRRERKYSAMKCLYYKFILCKPHTLFDKPIIFEEIRTGKYLIII